MAKYEKVIIVEILVDGKVTMTLPSTIHADGTIWSTGSPSRPVINSALAESRGLSREICVAQLTSGKYTSDILSCGMVLGDNFGNRVARDKEQAATETRIAAESALSPIDREKLKLREEIATVEQKARRCDRSEDDVEFRRLTWKAEKLQDDFYARFPEELASDLAAGLRERAENARRIADGAMLYDCDGELSYADQCDIRDRGYAEADALEAKANEIERAVNK